MSSYRVVTAPVVTAPARAGLLAWAALRIMWTEVLQTRREHQRDRAEQAATYKSLFAERAADHAEFTTAMTERLAAANLTQRELDPAPGPCGEPIGELAADRR